MTNPATPTFVVDRGDGVEAAVRVAGDDGSSIHTQADDWAALIKAMLDAVRCHFGEHRDFLVMVSRESAG